VNDAGLILAAELRPTNEDEAVRVRQATVITVNATDPPSVDIRIGGSSVTVGPVRYLATYAPVAGDTVWALIKDRKATIVLGRLAAAADPPGAPALPFGGLKRESDQSVGTSFTKVALNGTWEASSDTDSLELDTANNRIYVRRAGYWEADGIVRFTATTNQQNFGLFLRKNGNDSPRFAVSQIEQVQAAESETFGGSMTASGAIRLAVDDYIEAWVFAAVAVTLSMSSTGPGILRLKWLGP
jgi:hypothetical protein